MVASRKLALWSLLFVVCAAGFTHGQEVEEEDDEFEGMVQGAAGGLALTTTIKGSIVSDGFLKMIRMTSAQPRILIDDGKYKGIMRADGSFAVHNVPVGVHFLEVNALGWHFDGIRVEVFYIAKSQKVKTRAFTNNPTIVTQAIAYPLKLSPVTRLNYFTEREKFNPLNYLKNPMVLIMIATLFMAFIMPKMVDNMDEDEKKKIREGMSGGPMAALKQASGS